MAAMPSQIWIRAAGKDAPEWIVSFMATGDIRSDGSFDIDTPEGPTKVNVGDAVFVFQGSAHVCPPRLIQEKLREIAPEEAKAAAAPASITAAHAASYKREAAKTAKETPRFKPTIGSPCAPQFARIGDLLVDDTYQRSIEGGASQKAIAKMAAEWDWRLCLPLLVSRRDGRLYVIDGQHRKEAAELRGDIEQMPIVVFDLAGPKEEAELFVKANRARRPMSKLDDFHADLASGSEAARAIAQVVEDAGLIISRNGSWQMLKANEVMFVGIIGRALKSFGREIATLALSTIAKAFTDQVLIGAGAIFEGLCAIINEASKGGAQVELDLMEVVLAEVGLVGWKNEIEGAESGFDRRDAMIKSLRRAYDEARAQ